MHLIFIDHVEGTKTIFAMEGRDDIEVYGHKMTRELIDQDRKIELDSITVLLKV